MKRASQTTDTWKEEGMRDKQSLAQIYNGNNYMFNSGVAEGGTRKRKTFDKLSWETVYWKMKKNILLVRETEQ